MSRTAWTYLWGVILSTAGLVVVAQSSATHSALSDLALFLPTLTCMVILAVIAHFLEVRYGGHSYYPHFVPFFAGVLLLPPAGYVLLIAIPHVVESIKKHIQGEPYAWYVQPFNIATMIVSGLLAHQAFLWLGGDISTFSFQSTILAAAVAVGLFTLVNHLLVGTILVLGGTTWSESGVLAPEALLTDAMTVSLGYTTALLWNMSPWLLILVLAPFGLLHRALKVPQLEKEALTDGKTGLWNGRYFEQRLHEELAQGRQTGQTFSVIMSDLDLLREINNIHGHLAGDRVIEGVGRIIQGLIRKQDVACRFGGEEFAVLLPGVPLEQARAVAEAIRRQVAETPFTTSSGLGEISATLSLGVASFPEDGQSEEFLLNEADVALYQAKFRGGNQVFTTRDVPHSDHLLMEDIQESNAPVASRADAATETEAQIPERRTPATSVPISAAVSESRPGHSPVESDAVRHWIPLWLFVASVIGVGLSLAVTGLVMDFHVDAWLVLSILVALTVLAQWIQIEMYQKSSISISTAVIVAAAVIAGATGVVTTCLASAAVHYVRRRPAFYKSLFNLCAHMLAGAWPVVLIHLPAQEMQLLAGRWALLWWPVLLLASALLYYLTETGLVAGAIGLVEQNSIRKEWDEQFRWLAPQYLVMGVLGLFLALAYLEMGLLGIVVFSLPIIIMHQTQKEYVRRTESAVRELRRMNVELSQANGEIGNAKGAIEQLNGELFITLAKIIDARDPYVSGHATKVGDYARAIGQRLGVGGEQLGHLYQAGLLHDIGKIGIPEHILHKPSRLTQKEYEYVKLHAALGADFLNSCQGLRHLVPFVRHHHERWDGQGYPEGLQGEEIPLEARILAVCDAVEAMASDRPYQKGLPLPQILEELSRCSGTQFDSAVVDAFIWVTKNQPDLIVNSAPEVARSLPSRLLPWKSPSALEDLFAISMATDG